MTEQLKKEWFDLTKQVFDIKNISFKPLGENEGFVYRNGKYIVSDIWLDPLYNDIFDILEVNSFYEKHKVKKHYTFFHNVSLYEEGKDITSMRKVFSCYINFIYFETFTIILKIIFDDQPAFSLESDVTFRIDIMAKTKGHISFERNYEKFLPKVHVKLINDLKNCFEFVFENKLNRDKEKDIANWVNINKQFFLSKKISNIFSEEKNTFYSREKNTYYTETTFDFDFYKIINRLILKSDSKEKFNRAYAVRENQFLINQKKSKKDYELIEEKIFFPISFESFDITFLLIKTYHKEQKRVVVSPTPNNYFFETIIQLPDHKEKVEMEDLTDSQYETLKKLEKEFKFIFFDLVF